jgi:hypothetical protein
MKNINDKIALFLTKIVGTMWCAYIFACIALISLPDAIHGGIATSVSWVAQTFLQLVLLSVIMVGQDVQSQKTEKRSQEDHDTLMAEFQEIKDIHTELTIILKVKETS